MNSNDLYQAALKAMEGAYAPYSKFRVGAVVETISGNIYTGCNIENSSYSLTCCAERVAIFQAIANGERQFKQLVVTADTEDPISPCGACRQVIAEFFDKNSPITLYNKDGEKHQTSISALLPFTFTLQKD